MRDDSRSYETPEPRIDFGHVSASVVRKLPRILLVTLVLCGLAFAVLLFLPKLYESSANLLVEPRTNAYTSATVEQGNVQYLVDDAQIASQIELIKSRAIMLTVIDTLGLREVSEFAGGGGLLSILTGPPSPASLDERVIETLRSRTTVTRERDSRLLTIAVRSEDPELAARIANEIAAAHLTARTNQQLSDTATATGWLQEEIERLRSSVNAAEAEVAEFRIANDLYVGANNTSISDQQLSTFSSQIAAAAERRGAAQSRAEMIAQMVANGQSVTGLPDVQSSPVIQSLSQELARLQGLRAERSATLLPSHPDIRALDGQIAQIQTQIASEARQVAAAFQSQAQIEADLEQSLRDELAQATTVAGAATRQGVTLAELEREVAAQRDLLNAYLLRYTDAASRTENGSALPDVRLVSEAAPSSTPAFPQTLLILVAVALVSLVFQVAAIIFSELLSGRAMAYEVPVARHVAPPEDDRMPFEPIDGSPARAAAVQEAALGDVRSAPAREPGWGVLSPNALDDRAPVDSALVSVAATDFATHTHTAEPLDAPSDSDDLPHSEEATMLSLALSRVISASNAVIAAMPSGYGIYSPEYLGHGFAVAPQDHDMASNEGESGDAISEEPTSDDEGAVAAADVMEMPDAPAEASAREAELPEVSDEMHGESPVLDADPEVVPALASTGGRTARERARASVDDDIDRLAQAMLSGAPRTLVVASTEGWQESCVLAERLGERLLAGGVSVVEIDAASGTPGVELGLSDLAAGDADFGDVVHRGDHRDFSFVPWGQIPTMDRRSRKVATLVEALADVHECVIVVTGRLGMASHIGMFVDLGAECALITGESGVNAAILEDLSELGFADLHVVSMARARSDVA